MPIAPALSIIIPSYNGKKLLQKNLVKAIEALKKDDELIVVDDGSNDGTIHYLSRKYKLDFAAVCGDKYGSFELYTTKLSSKSSLKVIVNLENLRFAASVNRAVEQAKHENLFVVNNDVSFERTTLTALLKSFDDKKMFAVGCLETEPNQGNIKGGKNKLYFKKGLFQHQRSPEFETGPTAWASGGSAMFNRSKWLQLGGFDTDFYPAYWEDIDLSYRAKQQGWKVHFNSQAKVIHSHESTNKAVFTASQLQNISWRNARRFTKKHANWKQKIHYYLYKPYWNLLKFKQALKSKYFIFLLLVLLLAFILRFYKLGTIPAGMTWDEAAIGYNGYSVITTRYDEWLERLPVSFKSFGDYKAPLAIYLVGVFAVVFDLNLLIVRLPFAIAGVLAVLAMIKLTQELLEIFQVKTRLNFSTLSLIAGLMLAVSPWHLHFTRTGFESGLALAFVLWGFYLLLQYLKKVHVVSLKEQLKILLPAVILLIASLYTYHSTKIFLPIILLVVLVKFFNKLKNQPYGLIISGGVGLAFLQPLIKDSLFGLGMTRAGTLIIGQSSSVIDVLSMICYRLCVHLSPRFLINGWTDTLRHCPGAWGVLLPVTYLFFTAGTLALFINIIKPRGNFQWLNFSALWILVGLLPAILGIEYPQANRALLALPGFLWLSLAGFNWILNRFKFKKNALRNFLFLIGSVYVINVALYLRYYYQVFAKNSTEAFNEGYLQAMQLAHDYERGVNNKPEVDQIVFSNYYGQAYIYALFVRKTHPIWYQGGSLIKYLFIDRVTDSDLVRENALIVGTNRDKVTQAQPDHLIYGSDGSIRFHIYYTGNN